MEFALALLAATAVPALVEVIRNLIGGRRVQRGDTLKLTVNGETLELNNMDAEQQRRLVDEWLQRLDADPSDGRS